MENDNKIRLSPSSLDLYLECPRCFWLRFNEDVHRPRGIFPSLPGGMDNVIKDYFDNYRKKEKLPPKLEGKIEGKLFNDNELLNKWRNWRTGLKYKDKKRKAVLFGALDDCLVKNNSYIPIDYKTRGYPPKGNSQKYYGNQLSCYALLLKENNYPVKDYAYLIYYYPKEVKENGVVDFEVEPIKLKVNIEEARKTFEDAIDLLNKEIPSSHSDCEYCNWLSDAAGFD